MVDMTQLQAIYGGTFDPVHYGHLKPVEILANQIGLNQVTIVPNNVPPHRPQPEATSDQRRHMLELAIADKPLFILDDRELKRDTPSYSAQTLREWRQDRREHERHEDESEAQDELGGASASGQCRAIGGANEGHAVTPSE